MRGAVCKGYQVWGRLSHGGMGDVWLARHSELALPVVLKTLRAHGDEPFDARYRRLLQEARLTARLSSPRVVRVLDVGVHTTLATGPDGGEPDSLPFLVEEYVDGIDLAEFDRRRRSALRRPLPLWAVADMTAQAAEGLHNAHQAGVVHCDVKPSNLFGAQHAQVKVGDFGIAVASTSSVRAVPVGTPLYMAPEQLLGAALDRRTDVYGLGATAFALRYGRAPYEGASDALRGHDGAGPVFPPASSPEEAYFQHVVSKMLAPRPESRYAQMTQVRHHLRALSHATAPRHTPVRVGPHSFEVGRTLLVFEVGDLARTESDVLVNSADSTMEMRDGVGQALRAAGGDELERDAMAGGERALGDCVHTGAGSLKARSVLHAVGGWQEVSCVTRATHRALLMAEELRASRIAFPAIATGGKNVSLECCADAMVAAVRTHLALGGSYLREVRFVLYTEASFRRFVEVAAGMLLGSDDGAIFDESVDAPPDRAGESAPTLFASSARSTPPPFSGEPEKP